jgi:hypothetical protein
MNVVSIGLAISSTRFPPVEPTWEFPPLSHEPGAICTWEACQTGLGAIAIASLNPPTHIHTHFRSTCMLWVGSGPPKPILGQNPSLQPPHSLPPRFLWRASLRWAIVFHYLCLGHMNMVSIGLAISSTRFPPVEPMWEFPPPSHEPEQYVHERQVRPVREP